MKKRKKTVFETNQWQKDLLIAQIWERIGTEGDIYGQMKRIGIRMEFVDAKPEPNWYPWSYNKKRRA